MESYFMMIRNLGCLPRLEAHHVSRGLWAKFAIPDPLRMAIPEVFEIIPGSVKLVGGLNPSEKYESQLG